MCGIAGIAGPGLTAERLMAMTRALRHRGPDEAGHYIHRRIGLGHRRLSIIDLASGQQPMANEDESIWVTFNGEIFNFRELRRQLEARGHTFRTQSDTEVLVHGYEEWGGGMPERLRGEFAFALYDAHREQVVIARDRLGIKPLVFALAGESLVFASEIKAVLASGLVPRDVDPVALHHYLGAGYILHPQTAFEAIRKLEPGHAMVYDVAGGTVRSAPYWALRLQETERGSFEDCKRRVLDLLRDAVRVRMISDVPIGALLSGGVDSSAVVALMSEVSTAPVRTFSIGVAHADYDERRYARMIAERFGTEHCEQVVTPGDLLESFKSLVAHYDEPFADSSALPTYLVTKLARERVTVALSGDGADELFVGYPRYRWLQRYRYLDYVPGVARACRWLGQRFPEPPRRRGLTTTPVRLTKMLGRDALDRYLAVRGCLSELERRGLYGDALSTAVAGCESRSMYTEKLVGADSPSPVNRLSYLELLTYVPGDINVKVDIASMRNSLEVRVPLLDHHLVEYVAALPFAYKMRGLSTKHILKEALRGLVPDEILFRPKRGFEIPVGRWFRNELRDWVRDVLCSSRARTRGVLRAEAVERLVQSHQSGQEELGHILWTLMVLEQWFTQYVDEISPPAASDSMAPSERGRARLQLQ